MTLALDPGNIYLNSFPGQIFSTEDVSVHRNTHANHTIPIAIELGWPKISLKNAGWVLLALVIYPLVLIVKCILWTMDCFDNESKFIIDLKNDITAYVQSQEVEPWDHLIEIIDIHAQKKGFPKERLQLFATILAVNEFRFYIREILAGANIELSEDSGFFDRLVTHIPSVYNRPSSHLERTGTSAVGITDKFCSELLMWEDPYRRTRMQLERRGLNHQNCIRRICSTLLHGDNFLVYRLFNRQQSSFGSSKHVDSRSIVFPRINPERFQENQAYLCERWGVTPLLDADKLNFLFQRGNPHSSNSLCQEGG